MNGTFGIWALLVLGQAAQPAAPGAVQSAAANEAAAAVRIESVWDFVVKGGPVMVPIGLCSLAALTLVVERLLSLRRRNVIPAAFLPGLKQVLGNGIGDKKKALDYCALHPWPIARVLAAGIKKLGEPVELVERHIEETGQREVVKLRKYLRGLSVIGSVAPLLGLLGTITGMITAFQTVAASAEALGRTELLAKGIYEAMITTAAGLIVAIPTVIAYHAISAKVDRLINEIDSLSMDFVESYAAAWNTRPQTVAPISRSRGEVEALSVSDDGDGRGSVVTLAV